MDIIKKGAKAAGKFLAPGAAKAVERYGPKPDEGSRLGLLGKDILRAAFPGVYAVTDKLKLTGGKKKTKKRDKKSAVAESVSDLAGEVVETNTILTASIEAQTQQNLILEEILKAIKEGKGGGGGSVPGADIPPIPGLRRGPKGGRGPKGAKGAEKNAKDVKGPKGAKGPKEKIFKNAAEAKKAGGGKYYDKNGRLQEVTKNANGKWSSRFTKNISAMPEAKPSILGKAGSAGGGALRVLGKVAGPLAVAGLVYDIHNTTREDIEEKMNSDWNQPGSFNKWIKSLFGGDKEEKKEQKFETESITYSADDIKFKSNSMSIKAREFTIKGDIGGLNLGSSSSGSILPLPAKGDAEDRRQAVEDIGKRFKGQGGGIVVEAQDKMASIRKMPLSPELKQTLTTAAKEAGVNIRVTSGGQPAAPGGPRTGSTRHDNGNAADLDVISGGRILNDSKPDDIKIKQTFVKAARQAGATGIGAGYMGPEKIHVGFGTKATWGGASWLQGYADGTNSVPKTGPAVVGERGRETVVRNGKTFVTPNKASVVKLNQGDKVIPAEESGAIGSFFEELTSPLTGKATSDESFIKRATGEVMSGDVKGNTIGKFGAKVVKGFSPVGLDEAGDALRNLSHGDVTGFVGSTVRAAPFGGFVADTFNKITEGDVKPPPSPMPTSQPKRQQAPVQQSTPQQAPAPQKKMKKAEADTGEYSTPNMLQSMFGSAA